MTKYGNSTPDPSKLKNMDFVIANKNVLLLRFQQALNHYLEIILSQNIFLPLFTDLGKAAS